MSVKSQLPPLLFAALLTAGIPLAALDPWLPGLTVTPGGAPVYGVIFWDTGTSSTVEPVFRTLTLAPGAAQDFTVKVQWQK